LLHFGFFAGKNVRGIQGFLDAKRATDICITLCLKGFLDAKRATDICITLCLKGFLRSRWSVEMTGFWGGRGET
jgi:hypothetical protein